MTLVLMASLMGLRVGANDRVPFRALIDTEPMMVGFCGPGCLELELLLVRLTGERRLETLFEAAGVERNPAIAPSGRFITYNSDESRRAEVYVRPYPNASSRRWQISTEGGSGPLWTRSGSEIILQGQPWAHDGGRGAQSRQ